MSETVSGQGRFFHGRLNLEIALLNTQMTPGITFSARKQKKSLQAIG
jgi:hypothetical protein